MYMLYNNKIIGMEKKSAKLINRIPDISDYFIFISYLYYLWMNDRNLGNW